MNGASIVYVADTGNNTIRKITAVGVTTTFAGTAGTVGSTDGMGSMARFNYLRGVASDGAGNIYVADLNGTAFQQGFIFNTSPSPGRWPGKPIVLVVVLPKTDAKFL